MSYLESISLTKTLPCLADPGKMIVIGKPSGPLDEVLPYLATLPGVLAWNPDTRTLTFRRPRGFLTVCPDKVYITQINDTAEGLELLASLTDAVNEVWEKRSELIAMTTRKRAPRHLDIWELLPRTNCKQCGEATCMAFAVGLLQKTHDLDECLLLMADPTLADRRATLESMLG